MTATVLKQLHDELAAKNNEALKFAQAGDLDNAKAASAEADEIQVKYDKCKADLEDLANITKKANEVQKNLKAPVFTVPVPGGKKSEARIDAGESETDRLLDDGGFKSLGHYTYAVRTGSSLGGRLSDPAAIESMQRWNGAVVKFNEHIKSGAVIDGIKVPSGMQESVDPEGGELVPRGFSNQIYRRITAPTRLFGRVSPVTVAGNNMEIPRLKENSRANGSRHGGVRGYWHGTKEAQQYTSSKPVFDNLGLKLKKLTVMSFVTNELLDDSFVALESWLNNVVPDEFDFLINDALINGDGLYQPLGIMNSGSKITVTAESGQGASTIVYKNVMKMHNRMLSTARSRAVWLINQECEPQLEQLYLSTGTAHGNPVYLPQGGGATEADLARLKGKPVIPTEQCQALGTEGDIIFADFGDVACIVKGGIKSEMSMHLRFDYDEMAYKWSFRMDARPYNNTALTPYKGSNTYSQIITLNSSRT